MSYLTFILTKSNIPSWKAIAKTETIIVGNVIHVTHDSITQSKAKNNWTRRGKGKDRLR